VWLALNMEAQPTAISPDTAHTLSTRIWKRDT
jgi:hypothetical protein